MRSVEEWIGKNDDARVPIRVRIRIFDRHRGRCHLSGATIMAGQAWDLDHIIALANGGRHRESNLAPVLRDHHREKTKLDRKAQSRIYKARKRHLGLKKPKRPIMGSRASGWKRKMDGTVERR